MATRFYLSASRLAEVNPDFAAWTRTTEGLRRRMSPTKDASVNASTTFWAGGAAAADETALARQFVSDGMAAGIAFVTTDTIKCQILCEESSTNDNINRQPIVVKVYSADGATLRATLLGLGHIGPNTTEWLHTGPRNKTVADSDVLTANYTTVEGDRLVIEVGGQVSSAAGSTVTGTQWFGAAGGSDLGENETDTTTTLNAWFEISRTVTFSDPNTIRREFNFPNPPPLRPQPAGYSALVGSLLLAALYVGPETLRAPTYTHIPKPPNVQVHINYVPNILLTTLSVPATPTRGLISWAEFEIPELVPFHQTNWPNPPNLLPQPFAVGSNAYDPQTLGANPTAQFDWPNPPGLTPQQPAVGRNALDLQTLGTSPFNLTNWPNPPGLPAPPDIGRNALDQATLAANPTAQFDWPNPPRLPAPPDAGRNALDQQTLGDNPFGLDDWPNPPSIKAIETEPQGTNNLLLTPPTAQYDWPIPGAAKSTPTDEPYNLQLTTWALVPFTPGEITQPKPIVSLQPDTTPNLLGTTLTSAAEVLPFRQSEWPLPAIAPKPPAPSSYRQSFGAAATDPFVQINWPNPPSANTQQPEVLPNLTIRLPLPETLPFSQGNWLNPPKRLEPDQTLHVLNLALGPMPFSKYDWPNPPARKITQPDVLPNVGIQLQPVPLIRQSDWPIPLGQKTQQPEVIPNVAIQLQVVPPVRQNDWSILQGRQTQQPEVLPNVTIGLPVAEETLPFRQTNWPNPPLKSLQQPEPGVSALSIPTLGGAPFSQTNWPNPQPATKLPPPLDPPGLVLIHSTRGLISFAEFEVPTLLATRGLVSWTEIETPGVGTRGLISWVEFEAPEFVAAAQFILSYPDRLSGGTHRRSR